MSGYFSRLAQRSAAAPLHGAAAAAPAANGRDAAPPGLESRVEADLHDATPARASSSQVLPRHEAVRHDGRSPAFPPDSAAASSTTREAMPTPRAGALDSRRTQSVIAAAAPVPAPHAPVPAAPAPGVSAAPALRESAVARPAAEVRRETRTGAAPLDRSAFQAREPAGSPLLTGTGDPGAPVAMQRLHDNVSEARSAPPATARPLAALRNDAHEDSVFRRPAAEAARERRVDVRIGTVQVELRTPPLPAPPAPAPAAAPAPRADTPRFSPSRHYLRWG